MNHDPETGEIYSNGVKAARIASQTHMQAQLARMNVGDSVLHDAIGRAISKMPVWITTDKQGAHRIKYATLKAILEVVRPPLMEHGVRIRQGTEMTRTADEGGGAKGRLIPVYTDLIHVASGLVDRTMIEIPIMRLDPQSVGSAVTYGRRYTLLAGLGLASDEADDDGMAAKPRDLTAKTEASAALETLIEELRVVKDVASLTKWAVDPKNKRRIDDLTEAEAERLRIAYADHREKLAAE